MSLSGEQKLIFDAVEKGESIFFTGKAGCGKSFLLNALVERFQGEGTFVTASTGIAAVAIGGTTLHSFAGIGLGKGDAASLAEGIKYNREKNDNWVSCRLLIIDEISMIDADLFEKLELVARIIRDNQKPFGGIQLVVCGDFLQLPPVKPFNEGDARLCFQAGVWDKCLPRHYVLTKVFRQKNRDFVNMLSEFRLGTCSEESLEKLRACTDRPFDCSDGVTATILHARRKNVAEENQEKLEKLPGNKRLYNALENGQKAALALLDRNCQAHSLIELKMGAQVMLLKNMNMRKGLCNGSRGVVVGFAKWAEADAQALQVNRDNWWPRVRFTNKQVKVITPVGFEIRSQGKRVASRLQLPLILAWSMTIHKCQGMTLPRVRLNLSSVFELGQAYVALSRVVDIEQLSLVGFKDRDAKRIGAHPLALEFHKNIEKRSLKRRGSESGSGPESDVELDQSSPESSQSPKRAKTE